MSTRGQLSWLLIWEWMS